MAIRARAALDAAPDDAMRSGVSFGADLVGKFWQNRPQKPGALLFAGVTPWMRQPPPGLKAPWFATTDDFPQFAGHEP